MVDTSEPMDALDPHEEDRALRDMAADAPAPLVDRSVVREQLVARLDLARTERQPHLDKSLKYYELYLNEYDWTDKEAWQAKGYVPSMSVAVGFVADTAKAAVTENKDKWASLDGNGPLGKLAAPILLALGYDCLERHRFAQNLKPNIKAGLLSPGMYWKVYPAADPLYPGDTQVDPVDWRLIVKDPSGRDKFLYHVDCYDYADILRMGTANRWDMDAVRQLQNDGGNDDPDKEWRTRFAQMTGTREEGQYRRAVYLAEYYGPIYDPDGNEMYPFAYCVFANARLVLMDPVPKPFGDDEGCIVGSDLDARLGTPYGKAFAEDGAGLAENLTRMFNAFVDGAVYDMIPIFGVQQAQLVDKKQLNGGVRPGRTVYTHGDPATVVKRLETGNPRQSEAMAVYQMAQQEFQGATNATDISRGVPAQKGARENTLGEFQLKDTANQRTLSALAIDIEDNSLAPMFQRLITFIGRGVDLNDAEAQKVAGREIQEAMATLTANPTPDMLEEATGRMWPPVFHPVTGAPLPPNPEVLAGHVQTIAMERLQAACRERFNVRVRGISSQLSKKEKAVAALNAVNVLMQTPGAKDLDWDKIPSLVAEVNGIDPTDMLLDDEAKKARAQGPPPPPEWMAAFIDANFQNLSPEAQAAALVVMGFPEDVAMAHGAAGMADAEQAQAQQAAKAHARKSDNTVDNGGGGGGRGDVSRDGGGFDEPGVPVMPGGLGGVA